MIIRPIKTSKSKQIVQCGKLQVEDLEIILFRKNIRSIRLTVTPGGEVRLSIPTQLSDADAMFFAEARLPWIQKHLTRIEKQIALEPEDFSSVLFLGKSWKTVITYDKIAPRVFTDEAGKIHIILKPGSPSSDVPKILDAWYRSELKKMIPPLIKEWEPIMNVKVHSLQFKHMKTRWGTCNVIDHRIWLNVELAKKPFPCIEYILVHEMTHLLERGHGTEFKACMNKFLPDWRSLRKELIS